MDFDNSCRSRCAQLLKLADNWVDTVLILTSSCSFAVVGVFGDFGLLFLVRVTVQNFLTGIDLATFKPTISRIYLFLPIVLKDIKLHGIVQLNHFEETKIR